jgi:DNA-binding NtrC family response regulator
MISTLLVDDDLAILELFRTVLEMDGFQVDIASSAAQAIPVLGRKPYEVIITDLRMETSTAGFDVVRAAAKIEPRPLVVVVTAYPVPAAEWRKTGADALFIKGANTLALSEQLKKLLKQMTRSESPSGAPLRRAR